MTDPIPKWKYCLTRLSGHDGEDVQEHFDQQAQNGWELVNGSAIWCLSVDANMTPGHVGFPVSTGTLIREFYWRRPASG